MVDSDITASNLRFSFCPGKATWFPEIAELFHHCRIAYETGILPDTGALLDQDEMFNEVFPFFVERWKEKSYGRVWGDVRKYTEKILTAIFGKKGGKR